MSIGALNCTAPLQRVLVRRPSPALSSADPVKWHYADKVDYSIAQEEHDALVAIIKEELPSCEILYHDTVDDGLVDAMFVHDPLVITSKGAILFNMGKELRKREPDLLVSSLEKLEIPILARLSEGWNGKGEEPTMEGGDMLWLDDHTVCIGIGFRTNMAGVEALRAIFRKSELEIEVLAFDLPYFQGREACLHLLSLISLIRQDLAIVYLPLLPTRLYNLLVSRNISLLSVPESEFMQTQATNVLALSPDVCLMLRGNTETQKLIEAAGVRVRTYKGDELSLKCEGGATCLTRAVLR